MFGIVKAAMYMAGGGLVVYGIYRHFKKQAELASDYSYEIKSIRVNDIKKGLVDLAIGLEVENKSSLTAKITDLDVDVFIEGQYVGKIVEQSTLVIPASATKVWDLRLVFKPEIVLRNLWTVALGVQSKRDISIVLNGRAKVESGILKVSIPVKATYGKDYFIDQI